MATIFVIYIIFVFAYCAYGYFGIFLLRKMDCMDLTSEDAIWVYTKASTVIIVLTVIAAIAEIFLIG